MKTADGFDYEPGMTLYVITFCVAAGPVQTSDGKWRNCCRVQYQIEPMDDEGTAHVGFVEYANAAKTLISYLEDDKEYVGKEVQRFQDALELSR